ncbi:MAG: hypothetical protein Q9201_002732 [Fulgogasparrea decipioides]
MNGQYTSQTNLAPQRSHLSVGSQAQPTLINDRDPRDGFDYQDQGPSQTPSKKKGGEPVSGAASQLSTDPNNAVDYQQLVKKLDADLYERETKGTRARFPDRDHSSIRGPALSPVSGTPSQLSSSSSTSRRHDRRRRNDKLIPTTPSRAADKTRPRRVALNWRKELVDSIQQIILTANVSPVDPRLEPHNSVTWQHSNFEDIKLLELETLVTGLTEFGLQDSEVGLTKRLLKRVRLVSERAFVGGSFLTPTAIRYDMLNDSRYGADKCCAFLNFPFFAVRKAQKKAAFVKGDSKHPTRTLLQSRYRLNETIDRDDSQCIRMLDARSLKSCIKAPEAETAHLTRGGVDELIYVPQMWALIMGRDHMATAGPISDQALQGSTIGLRDHAALDTSQRCTLVRISFMNRGVPEEITYPLEQCASWFGLLNKHQQIRSALRQGKEETAPKDYPLQIGEHVLTDRTWASVQRSTDGEILRLWMETPKPPKVTVNNTDSESGSEAGQATEGEHESLAEARRTSKVTSADFPSLDRAPVVKAFLTWRVVDDFGETDDRSVDEQPKRFLNAIYETLPVTCAQEVSVSGAQTATSGRNSRSGRNPRPKISVTGKTRRDTDELGWERSVGKTEISIEQKVYWASSRLLAYFVPAEYDKTSAPIQVFWGIIYELLENHVPYLHRLLDILNEINGWAETLHLGVHFQRPVKECGRRTEYQDANSESAILQASMVDALGAIYNLLVEAVRVARHGNHSHNEQELALGKRVAHYGREACRLLEIARNQLITEATVTATAETVGPVVTPEAILIMILERLACGVFGTGSVDVINILEECLEQLALRVEKHSSRRLLQKLNAFEEEVDVVNEVLLQQIQVLSAFRDCLDPTKFKRPTTARKMRFEFEKQGIERILIHIREQLRHCTELRERAKVLAVQNVQLVETLADDNSRAIFVFTFITVLFLPLSFVAGFFGMNLAGIADTKSKVRHFWYIALPLTGGILVLCAVFVAWGESIWFAVADLPRYCKRLVHGREKKKR